MAISLFLVTGCGIRELPPLAAPPATLPEIVDAPIDPPAPGTGRLLISTEGEPARVSRVTSPPVVVDPDRQRFFGLVVAPDPPRTELLCTTPCVVDLATGGHSLVFTSTANPGRTSIAEIAVPEGTTALRHAIGTNKPLNGSYFAGAVATVTGTIFTLTGGTFLAGVATEAHSPDESQRPTLITAGTVITMGGLSLLGAGIALMTRHRPERGPGATTMFAVR